MELQADELAARQRDLPTRFFVRRTIEESDVTGRDGAIMTESVTPRPIKAYSQLGEPTIDVGAD